MKVLKVAVFFIGVLSLCVQSALAQERTEIIIVNGQGMPLNDSGDRSANVSPTAFIESQYITVNYPLSTVSEVVIRDADTDAVVYSAPYGATRQVIVDLSSLPEGTYELRLYAFGKWWWGEFELGE